MNYILTSNWWFTANTTYQKSSFLINQEKINQGGAFAVDCNLNVWWIIETKVNQVFCHLTSEYSCQPEISVNQTLWTNLLEMFFSPVSYISLCRRWTELRIWCHAKRSVNRLLLQITYQRPTFFICLNCHFNEISAVRKEKRIWMCTALLLILFLYSVTFWLLGLRVSYFKSDMKLILSCIHSHFCYHLESLGHSNWSFQFFEIQHIPFIHNGGLGY